MRKLLIGLTAAIFLAGCTVKPETPAQDVYLAESDYAAALKVELAYSNLPRCGSGPKICSKVSIIKTLQKSDDVAWAAIQQAQIAVRDPNYGDSAAKTAILSATALTNAFVSITNTLEIK